MNKTTRYLFFTTVLSCSTLYAQPEIYDFGPHNIAEEEKERPFFVEIYGDAIGKGKVSKSPFEGNIQYREIEGTANVVFLYNPTCKEGLYASVGYDYCVLDWTHNVFFHDKYFHTAIFGLGAFTERVHGWLLNSYVTVNMDTDHFNFDEYTTYDILLWGRYAYNCNWGIHVGFLALVGLQMEHVYPVIGFDWKINDRFKINAVFPMDMAIVYTYNKEWSLEIAGRFIDSRHRVDKHAPLSKGIFDFKTIGTELGVNYEYCSWLMSNIHVGYTWGGVLKIADKHNRRRKHIDFDAAPYFGAEVVVRF